MEPLDILAFSPHPDDLEIACAGSVLLATDRRLRVAVADLTNGERASRGTVEERKTETRKASELLGLVDRVALNLPDTEIGFTPYDYLPLLELIRKTRPRVVLSPYGSERHPDHEATCRLVKSACFYAGVSSVGPGKVHRPEHLFHYMIHTPFEPSFVIDVSGVWDRRMAALQAYRSQFEAKNEEGATTALCRPEFMRFIEARAVYFGAMIGAAYGEPFFSNAPLALKGLQEFTESRERKTTLAYRTF